MNYQSEVLADGPSAYWRFDDNTDSSVNNNVLIPAGTIPAVTGLIAVDTSVARSFTNNSANRYEVADHATVDLGDNFTIEVWVTVSSLPAAGAYLCVCFKDGTSPFVGVIDSGRFIGRTGGVADFVTSASTITLGVPYHLVITKNGAASALYLNGQDDTGAQISTTCADNISNWRVGRSVSPAYPWDGKIDELAFYQSVLTPTQVQAHYEAGVTGPAVAWLGA